MTQDEIASALALMQQAMNERIREDLKRLLFADYERPDDPLTGGIDRSPNPFCSESPMTVAAISDAAAQLADLRPHAIPVTPEMLRAGAAAWTACEDLECLQHVYRAMAALVPLEFCPEDRIAALTKERDEARAERDKWMDHTKFVMRDRITLRTRLAERDASLVKAARGRV